MMAVDYPLRQIQIINKNSQEIRILTPKLEEWPVRFIRVDDNHSKLLRHFAETDQQFLDKFRKEIQQDPNVVLLSDFQYKDSPNLQGYLVTYLVRTNHQLICHLKVLNRGQFQKIICVDYQHVFLVSDVFKVLGNYRQSQRTRDVFAKFIQDIQDDLFIDKKTGLLIFQKGNPRSRYVVGEGKKKKNFIYQL